MLTDLETLIAEFSRWHRGEKSGRVPNHLKKVIELGQNYSSEQLASYLTLKASSINQWKRQGSFAKRSPLSNDIAFVKLTPPKTAQSEDHSERPTLTLELSNGIKLLLSGQNPNELIELASGLAKRLST